MICVIRKQKHLLVPFFSSCIGVAILGCPDGGSNTDLEGFVRVKNDLLFNTRYLHKA